MVTIKRKVTIRIKTPENPTSDPVGPTVSTEGGMSSGGTTEREPTPPPPPPVNKSNTGKIIGGIVAATAILAGIYFFGIKDNGSTTTEQVAQVEKSTGSGNAETANGTNTGGESTPTNAERVKEPEVAKAPAAAEQESASAIPKVNEKADETSTSKASPAQPAKLSSAKQTTTAAKAVSAPVDGDIEENARRAIRGDFGNGQTRKDKLGASYPEIQGRVNEMYRQGLIK